MEIAVMAEKKSPRSAAFPLCQGCCRFPPQRALRRGKKKNRTHLQTENKSSTINYTCHPGTKYQGFIIIIIIISL